MRFKREGKGEEEEGEEEEGEEKRTHSGVEDDDRATQVPFVAVICLDEHYNRSSHVRWSNEALSLCNVETHTISEDDWEEVCNGIGIGGREDVEHREAPYLPVETSSEIGAKMEWLNLDIGSIVFDTCDDEVGFFLVEKMPRSW